MCALALKFVLHGPLFKVVRVIRRSEEFEFGRVQASLTKVKVIAHGASVSCPTKAHIERVQVRLALAKDVHAVTAPAVVALAFVHFVSVVARVKIFAGRFLGRFEARLAQHKLPTLFACIPRPAHAIVVVFQVGFTIAKHARALTRPQMIALVLSH